MRPTQKFAKDKFSYHIEIVEQTGIDEVSGSRKWRLKKTIEEISHGVPFNHYTLDNYFKFYQCKNDQNFSRFVGFLVNEIGKSRHGEPEVLNNLIDYLTKKQTTKEFFKSGEIFVTFLSYFQSIQSPIETQICYLIETFAKFGEETGEKFQDEIRKLLDEQLFLNAPIQAVRNLYLAQLKVNLVLRRYIAVICNFSRALSLQFADQIPIRENSCDFISGTDNSRKYLRENFSKLKSHLQFPIDLIKMLGQSLLKHSSEANELIASAICIYDVIWDNQLNIALQYFMGRFNSTIQRNIQTSFDAILQRRGLRIIFNEHLKEVIVQKLLAAGHNDVLLRQLQNHCLDLLSDQLFRTEELALIERSHEIHQKIEQYRQLKCDINTFYVSSFTQQIKAYLYLRADQEYIVRLKDVNETLIECIIKAGNINEQLRGELIHYFVPLVYGQNLEDAFNDYKALYLQREGDYLSNIADLLTCLLGFYYLTESALDQFIKILCTVQLEPRKVTFIHPSLLPVAIHLLLNVKASAEFKELPSHKLAKSDMVKNLLYLWRTMKGDRHLEMVSPFITYLIGRILRIATSMVDGSIDNNTLVKFKSRDTLLKFKCLVQLADSKFDLSLLTVDLVSIQSLSQEAKQYAYFQEEWLRGEKFASVGQEVKEKLAEVKCQYDQSSLSLNRIKSKDVWGDLREMQSQKAYYPIKNSIVVKLLIQETLKIFPYDKQEVNLISVDLYFLEILNYVRDEYLEKWAHYPQVKLKWIDIECYWNSMVIEKELISREVDNINQLLEKEVAWKIGNFFQLHLQEALNFKELQRKAGDLLKVAWLCPNSLENDSNYILMNIFTRLDENTSFLQEVADQSIRVGQFFYELEQIEPDICVRIHLIAQVVPVYTFNRDCIQHNIDFQKLVNQEDLGLQVSFKETISLFEVIESNLNNNLVYTLASLCQHIDACFKAVTNIKYLKTTPSTIIPLYQSIQSSVDSAIQEKTHQFQKAIHLVRSVLASKRVNWKKEKGSAYFFKQNKIKQLSMSNLCEEREISKDSFNEALQVLTFLNQVSDPCKLLPSNSEISAQEIKKLQEMGQCVELVCDEVQKHIQSFQRWMIKTTTKLDFDTEQQILTQLILFKNNKTKDIEKVMLHLNECKTRYPIFYWMSQDLAIQLGQQWRNPNVDFLKEIFSKLKQRGILSMSDRFPQENEAFNNDYIGRFNLLFTQYWDRLDTEIVSGKNLGDVDAYLGSWRLYKAYNLDMQYHTVLSITLRHLRFPSLHQVFECTPNSIFSDILPFLEKANENFKRTDFFKSNKREYFLLDFQNLTAQVQHQVQQHVIKNYAAGCHINAIKVQWERGRPGQAKKNYRFGQLFKNVKVDISKKIGYGKSQTFQKKLESENLYSHKVTLDEVISVDALIREYEVADKNFREAKIISSNQLMKLQFHFTIHSVKDLDSLTRFFFNLFILKVMMTTTINRKVMYQPFENTAVYLEFAQPNLINEWYRESIISRLGLLEVEPSYEISHEPLFTKAQEYLEAVNQITDRKSGGHKTMVSKSLNMKKIENLKNFIREDFVSFIQDISLHDAQQVLSFIAEQHKLLESSKCMEYENLNEFTSQYFFKKRLDLLNTQQKEQVSHASFDLRNLIITHNFNSIVTLLKDVLFQKTTESKSLMALMENIEKNVEYLIIFNRYSRPIVVELNRDYISEKSKEQLLIERFFQEEAIIIDWKGSHLWEESKICEILSQMTKQENASKVKHTLLNADFSLKGDFLNQLIAIKFLFATQKSQEHHIAFQNNQQLYDILWVLRQLDEDVDLMYISGLIMQESIERMYSEWNSKENKKLMIFANQNQVDPFTQHTLKLNKMEQIQIVWVTSYAQESPKERIFISKSLGQPINIKKVIAREIEKLQELDAIEKINLKSTIEKVFGNIFLIDPDVCKGKIAICFFFQCYKQSLKTYSGSSLQFRGNAIFLSLEMSFDRHYGPKHHCQIYSDVTISGLLFTESQFQQNVQEGHRILLQKFFQCISHIPHWPNSALDAQVVNMLFFAINKRTLIIQGPTCSQKSTSLHILHNLLLCQESYRRVFKQENTKIYVHYEENPSDLVKLKGKVNRMREIAESNSDSICTVLIDNLNYFEESDIDDLIQSVQGKVSIIAVSNLLKNHIHFNTPTLKQEEQASVLQYISNYHLQNVTEEAKPYLTTIMDAIIAIFNAHFKDLSCLKDALLLIETLTSLSKTRKMNEMFTEEVIELIQMYLLGETKQELRGKIISEFRAILKNTPREHRVLKLQDIIRLGYQRPIAIQTSYKEITIRRIKRILSLSKEELFVEITQDNALIVKEALNLRKLICAKDHISSIQNFPQESLILILTKEELNNLKSKNLSSKFQTFLIQDDLELQSEGKALLGKLTSLKPSLSTLTGRHFDPQKMIYANEIIGKSALQTYYQIAQQLSLMGALSWQRILPEEIQGDFANKEDWVTYSFPQLIQNPSQKMLVWTQSASDEISHFCTSVLKLEDHVTFHKFEWLVSIEKDKGDFPLPTLKRAGAVLKEFYTSQNGLLVVSVEVNEQSTQLLDQLTEMINAYNETYLGINQHMGNAIQKSVCIVITLDSNIYPFNKDYQLILSFDWKERNIESLDGFIKEGAFQLEQQYLHQHNLNQLIKNQFTNLTEQVQGLRQIKKDVVYARLPKEVQESLALIEADQKLKQLLIGLLLQSLILDISIFPGSNVFYRNLFHPQDNQSLSLLALNYQFKSEKPLKLWDFIQTQVLNPALSKHLGLITDFIALYSLFQNPSSTLIDAETRVFKFESTLKWAEAYFYKDFLQRKSAIKQEGCTYFPFFGHINALIQAEIDQQFRGWTSLSSIDLDSSMLQNSRISLFEERKYSECSQYEREEEKTNQTQSLLNNSRLFEINIDPEGFVQHFISKIMQDQGERMPIIEDILATRLSSLYFIDYVNQCAPKGEGYDLVLASIMSIHLGKIENLVDVHVSNRVIEGFATDLHRILIQSYRGEKMAQNFSKMVKEVSDQLPTSRFRDFRIVGEAVFAAINRTLDPRKNKEFDMEAPLNSQILTNLQSIAKKYIITLNLEQIALFNYISIAQNLLFKLNNLLHNNDLRERVRHALRRLKRFFIFDLQEGKRLNIYHLFECLEATITEIGELQNEGIPEKTLIQYLGFSKQNDLYLDAYKLILPKALLNNAANTRAQCDPSIEVLNIMLKSHLPIDTIMLVLTKTDKCLGDLTLDHTLFEQHTFTSLLVQRILLTFETYFDGNPLFSLDFSIVSTNAALNTLTLTHPESLENLFRIAFYKQAVLKRDLSNQDLDNYSCVKNVMEENQYLALFGEHSEKLHEKIRAEIDLRSRILNDITTLKLFSFDVQRKHFQ